MEALIFAAILAIADCIATRSIRHKHKIPFEFISFSAGVAIAYLMLRMLPELYKVGFGNERFIFFVVLLGFISIHLIEKYIYKQVKNLRKEHRIVHLGFFFVYSFFIGILLEVLSKISMTELLVFFVPFLLYTIIEIIPQHFTFKSLHTHLAYTAAPIYGVLFARYFLITQMMFNVMLAFIAGTLLYLITREAIPPEKKGKPVYFVIGVLIYAGIIVLSWNFV